MIIFVLILLFLELVWNCTVNSTHIIAVGWCSAQSAKFSMRPDDIVAVMLSKYNGIRHAMLLSFIQQ